MTTPETDSIVTNTSIATNTTIATNEDKGSSSETETTLIESILSQQKDVNTYYFPEKMPTNYKYNYVIGTEEDCYQERISMYLLMNIENVRPEDDARGFELSLSNRDWTSKDSHKEYISMFDGSYIYTDDCGVEIKIKYVREKTPYWNSMMGHFVYPYKIYIDAGSHPDSCRSIHRFHNKVAKAFSKTFDEKKTLTIYTANKHGDWLKYDRTYPREIKSIYMDETTKANLLLDMKNFIESEKDYQLYGIPYKRNYLLTGIPGSGKSSLIKSVCSELGYDICMLTIESEMTNHALIYAMSSLPKKSVLVVEDIDCLFNKRNTTKDSASFNFSTLLNILDGVLTCNGLISFVTTNHPEDLDHALVRQGRMDLVLQINYPKRADIKRLFYDMNENNPEYETQEEKKKAFDIFYSEIAGKNITMAAIMNFLFKYRKGNYREHIDDLVNTDKYIKEIMNESASKEGRLYT